MTISTRPAKPVSVARGALLSVAMRWTDRLIGIGSTLILARLLMPSDFGVIAMASIVVGLIDTLLDMGVNLALIQNRDATREDFDTAWTLRLLQTMIAAALVGLGAGWAADYFHNEQVTDVLRIMAISLLMGGLENIGVVAFQKNMEFGRDFRFFFLRRLAGFIVTITLAYWFRSYWAMVFGTLCARTFGVALSYLMHEFRPRISFRRLGALWSFSQWILVRNLGNYGLLQLDKFLIGRRTSAAVMGGYTLADEISALPSTELLAPIGRVLFPAFVRVADDGDRLRLAFAKALGIQTLVALPAGAGLALVAPDAVHLLLGEKWLAAIPLVQTLALMNIMIALIHSSGYLLLALGKIRIQAIFTWVQLLLLAIAILLVFPAAQAQGIAYIRLGIAAFGVVFFLGMVLYAVPSLRITDYLAQTWRPLLATAAMALLLWHVPIFPEAPLPLRLLAEIGVGGGCYLLVILLLWNLGGRRDGAELYFLELLRIKRP